MKLWKRDAAECATRQADSHPSPCMSSPWGDGPQLVSEDGQGENLLTVSSADLHVHVHRHLPRPRALSLDGTSVKGSPLTLLRFLPKS